MFVKFILFYSVGNKTSLKNIYPQLYLAIIFVPHLSKKVGRMELGFLSEIGFWRVTFTVGCLNRISPNLNN